MCRLYVAINDAKGNKIHRHGSHKRKEVEKKFLDCLMDYQIKKNYGYTIEIKKRKSNKVYKSYTIQKDITDSFIQYIIWYDIEVYKRHCEKFRKSSVCNDECYMCEIYYRKYRQEQLREMFFVKGDV